VPGVARARRCARPPTRQRNAWEATAEAVRKAQEKSREIAQGLAQDITGPIKEALKSGEFTWETFAGAISRIAQNLATRLIELGLQADRERPDQRLLGGGAGGGGGFLASLFGFAKGGVFAGGQELTAFARGWRGEPAHGVSLRAGMG
jgi:hypothetical protein